MTPIAKHFDKFKTRAIPCAFIGYAFGKKAYLLLNLKNLQVHTSRNVVFKKSFFSLHQYKATEISALPLPILDTNSDFIFPSTQHNSSHNHSPNLVSNPASSPIINYPTRRRTTRIHYKPAYLQDYICTNINTDANTKVCPCSHTLKKFQPIPKNICFNTLITNNQ